MKTDLLNAKSRIEIWRTLKSIDNVPTLPNVYFKLDQLLRDPNASIVKVRRVIEEDPPIVAKLLQRVNSGFYNLSREVTNIQQAIVMIGFTEIYNLVVELSVLSMFQKMKENKYFNFDRFWKHSAGTARIAASLRKHIGVDFNNTEFTAGLLHDFGRLIMCLYFPEKYNRVFEYSRIYQVTLYEAEKKELAFTHAEAGFWLAKQWGLPSEVAGVMLHHHDVTPKKVAANPLRAIIYVANHLANQWGYSQEMMPTMTDIAENPVWQELVKLYPKLASYPMENLVDILNMPSDKFDTEYVDSKSEDDNSVITLAALKNIVENLSNGFAELLKNLEEKTIPPKAAWQSVCETLGRHMFLDLMSLYRLNDESGELQLVFEYGKPDNPLDFINFRLGKGAIRWILQNKAPVFVKGDNPNTKNNKKRVNSFVGLPIMFGKKIIGVMAVGSFTPDCYGDNEKYLLEFCAEHIGRLMETAFAKQG
jgi:putative nucleotidyltransferase with HDIG domain